MKWREKKKNREKREGERRNYCLFYQSVYSVTPQVALHCSQTGLKPILSLRCISQCIEYFRILFSHFIYFVKMANPMRVLAKG